MSSTQFDMPHALVTLTDVQGNVEIEVWPKAGQSAYVVVPPVVARAIAEHMVRMADEAEARALASAMAELEEGSEASARASEDDAVGASVDEAPSEDATEVPANVVSLAARRRRSDA